MEGRGGCGFFESIGIFVALENHQFAQFGGPEKQTHPTATTMKPGFRSTALAKTGGGFTLQVVPDRRSCCC